MVDSYTENADAVITAEQQHILQNQTTQHKPQKFYGLALSGGGIRSSSFCLGVIQALVGGRVLEKMDYLSTASGGGYIGSALTWFLHRGLPDGKPSGCNPERFPFGRPKVAAHSTENNPNGILDFLRQHGGFLTPSSELDFVSFIGYALSTVLVSFVLCFALLTLFMIGCTEIGLFEPVIAANPWNKKEALLDVPNVLFLAALVLVAIFVIVSIGYSVITRAPLGSSAWRYSFRAYHQILLGWYLKLTGAALLLGSLPLAHNALHVFEAQVHAAGATTMLGTLIGWFQYIKGQRAKTANAPQSGGITSIVAAGLIIYGMLLGAYIIAHAIDDSPWPNWLFVTGLAALFIVVGWTLNINYTSLHRMYRDRLMEAFTPDIESVLKNRWELGREADIALIDDMCKPPNHRPYHLVNANLVLADSNTAKYRGRGGDSFIMSPLYCGSEATGWRQSADYMKRSGRGITLPTAMAISGAAINPNAANNGRGATRNRWVSILYSLLNLRLGYWAVNPKNKDRFWLVPNFFSPTLWQSILGKGLKETRHFIELSDAGHFDNLAVYELIRRKLGVIIVCDGGADPDYVFTDLGNVIERVRVDFGARIQFDDPAYALRWLLPGTADDKILVEKCGAARRGFAVARIDYADGSQGRLIYIKATLTEGMPVDVYSYKAENPAFPHQPTLDQFFDETQVEAYREVGYYVGWSMLETNAGVQSGQPVDPAKKGLWV